MRRGQSQGIRRKAARDTEHRLGNPSVAAVDLLVAFHHRGGEIETAPRLSVRSLT